MHCEVAVISLTYLVWKKKEEERVSSQQRTWRLDKGLKSISAPYRVEGRWQKGGRSALSCGGTGQGRRAGRCGTGVGTGGMRWSRKRFRGHPPPQELEAAASHGPWGSRMIHASLCMPLRIADLCEMRLGGDICQSLRFLDDWEDWQDCAVEAVKPLFNHSA